MHGKKEKPRMNAAETSPRPNYNGRGGVWLVLLVLYFKASRTGSNQTIATSKWNTSPRNTAVKALIPTVEESNPVTVILSFKT